jgi:hypothetical protein
MNGARHPSEEAPGELVAGRQAQRGSIWSVLAWVAIACAFGFYLPLVSDLRATRQSAMNFFLYSLLPVACAHVLCLLALSFGFRRKADPALVFWGASIIGFLALGQARFVGAFFLLILGSLVWTAVGDGIIRVLLPPERFSWGVRLGLGIVVSSVAGSVLALFHLFFWWSTALLLAPLLILAARRWREWLTESAASVGKWLRDWNPAKALAFESFFLLVLFVLVGAAAPESKSDAIRLYWPYVRMLDHFAGFAEMPYQWSYIIPQPGLTYAATVLAWFGPLAVRYSMVLVLISLVGICIGRSPRDRSLATALAVVMASCPIVLWTTTSLYQDAFVSLVTVLLALVCIEGRDPGSAKSWMGIGALMGLAWCAKYSTVVYAAPLGVWALIRGRSVGWRRNFLRCIGMGGGSALVVAAPWLLHTYNESGNPIFPFLDRLFPSPLWPVDLSEFGATLLRQFSLPPGIRGVLLAPIEFTFHTDRFIEGPAGFLGLAFPILIVLSLVASVRDPGSRIWIAVSAVGIALVWMQTGYVRYWLPGLWLLTAGVAGRIGPLFAGRAIRVLAGVVGIVIAVLQWPFAMVASWNDPEGWPWVLYRGATEEEQYLARAPGFRALRQMEKSGPPWPRFWYTGLEAVGNVRGIPLMAEVWEFHLHGAVDLESISRYVERARCDYWVVQTDSPRARYLEALGIGERFWTPGKLLTSDGPLKVYRMRALARFLRGTRPTTPAVLVDLIRNGGFEQGEEQTPLVWSLSGSVRRLTTQKIGHSGEAALKVMNGAAASQTVPIPVEVRFVRLSQWSRSATSRPLKGRLQLNWSRRSGTFLTTNIDVIQVSSEWDQFSMVAVVPPEARFVTVVLNSHNGEGAALFDDVRLEGANDWHPLVGPGGNFLRDGGFEAGSGDLPKYWASTGSVHWLSSESAKEGNRCLTVGPGGAAVQSFNVPPGLEAFRLGEWIRSGRSGQPTPIRLQINWSDERGSFLTTSIQVIDAGDTWRWFGMTAAVPKGAAHGTVYLSLHAGRVPAQFDAVELVAAP